MTTPTEHDLKLLLAKKLPEKITPINDALHELYAWKDSGRGIHDTEWDYIVRLAEKSMPEEMQEKYVDFIVNWDGGRYLFECVSMPWPDRAEAMKQCGFLKDIDS